MYSVLAVHHNIWRMVPTESYYTSVPTCLQCYYAWSGGWWGGGALAIIMPEYGRGYPIILYHSPHSLWGVLSFLHPPSRVPVCCGPVPLPALLQVIKHNIATMGGQYNTLYYTQYYTQYNTQYSTQYHSQYYSQYHTQYHTQYYSQ